MMQSPQVEAISNLRRNHVTVMNKLKNGPVFLAQRGALAATLVSIEEWDKIARRMQDLELLLLHYHRRAEMQADPSKVVTHEELERALNEKMAA